MLEKMLEKNVAKKMLEKYFGKKSLKKNIHNQKLFLPC